MKRDPSGYWSTIGVKGEAEGHPFRGNQWTTGEAGAAEELQQTIGGTTYRDIREAVAATYSAALKYAKQNVGTQTECGYLINGGKVEVLPGKVKGVAVTEGQMQRTEHFVHTHPIEQTFSAQDIAMFILFHNLKEADVVLPNGEVHQLQRPPNYNPPASRDRREFLAAQVMQADEWLQRELHPEFHKRYKNGEDEVALSKEMGEIIAKRLCEKMGVIFTKSKVQPAKGVRAGQGEAPAAGDDKIFVLDDSSIYKLREFIKKERPS